MATAKAPTDALECHPDYAQALADAGLATLDALMRVQSETDLNKPGLAAWRERIVLTVDVAGRPTTLFLKRYHHPPMREQLDQRLAGFPNSAAVEWYWLRELQQRGVAGPVPVAYGASRKGAIEKYSAAVTAAVPGVSLEKWVPTQAGPGGSLTNRRTKNKLADAVALLVQKLHHHKLIHRDLYLAHIFLDEASLSNADSPEEVTLTLIDLQRMIRPRLRWLRWVVKDLSALNYSTPIQAASTADRVRWFKKYRGVDKLTPKDRAILRRIAAKTARIARHDARRNKRLATSH